MGTSLYDRNNLSAPSFDAFDDNQQHRHRQSPSYKFVISPLQKRRKKKSPTKQENLDSVRDSLQRFLADSKDEDLLFQKDSIVSKPHNNDAMRDRAAPPRTEPLKTSRRVKKTIMTRKKRRSEQEEFDESMGSSKLFETSLANIFSVDDDSETDVSLSLSDLKSRAEPEPSKPRVSSSKRREGSSSKRRIGSSSKRREGSSSGKRREGSSGGKRREGREGRRREGISSNRREGRRRERPDKQRERARSKTKSPIPHQSPNKMQPRAPLRRTRSGGGRKSLGGNSCDNSKPKNASNGLIRGLSSLDRQVRRERMKKEYRGGSADRRGAESVASGMSQKSNRSYNRTGFEGGALNAIMGNKSIARHACNPKKGSSRTGSLSDSASFVSFANASINSMLADEDYLNERRVRQEKIIDAATREIWWREAQAEDESKELAKERAKVSEGYPSDDPTTKNEKGIVKKVKRGAKGAANAIMDPKKTAKKAARVANNVGKETLKVIKDPSLAAKRMRGAGNNDTEGDYASTRKESKRKLKGKKDRHRRLSSDQSNPLRVSFADDKSNSQSKSMRNINRMLHQMSSSFDTSSHKSKTDWWNL